jgi:O-antigen biosynthesis protein WbqP
MYSLYNYQLLKRFLDIMLALTGLIILSMPVLFIGFLIKLTSKGPIIHWSDRVGIENKIFKMAKIRTICCKISASKTESTLNKDKKYVLFGKFLRESGLDELPQLINILKGEMSFVGPRPVLSDEHELISKRTDFNIHTIRPGLSGLAQINGRKILSVDRKVYFDNIYLQNISFLLDFRIVFLTLNYLIHENFVLKRGNNSNDKLNLKTYPKLIKSLDESI